MVLTIEVKHAENVTTNIKEGKNSMGDNFHCGITALQHASSYCL